MTVALPPGPRLPGAAQAVLWGLRYPEFTRAARDRFGPTYTVRPGTMPPVVLTTDRDAIRRLFTGDPLGKRHGNDATRPLLDDRSLMLLPPDEHLARRRLLLPPFHGARVEAYAALMERLMEAEVARWRPGAVVAVLPAAQNVTIEVILQAVLGIRDVALRERFRRLIDDLLFYPLGALRLRVTGRLAPPFAVPAPLRAATAFAGALPTPAVLTSFEGMKARAWWNVGTHRWWRHHAAMMALLDELIAAARADPHLDARDDVLAMLVSTEGLSDADLRNDLLTLIGAGHETTAAAIAWGASLLAHHPDVREVDDALVREVLRIRPPIPVAAGRRLDEPFPIGPHVVPAGTLIMVDAWGLHHDPELYPEPASFRPERFADGPPEPYTWLPFGGGAHRCLGAPLAELEIGIALRTMLARFELEPAEAALAPTARRGLVVVPHAGGRVRVAAR